jgi:hypothetical protein
MDRMSGTHCICTTQNSSLGLSCAELVVLKLDSSAVFITPKYSTPALQLQEAGMVEENRPVY